MPIRLSCLAALQTVLRDFEDHSIAKLQGLFRSFRVFYQTRPDVHVSALDIEPRAPDNLRAGLTRDGS
jgi:hypothetical protein